MNILHINSYPSVYAIGHKAIPDIFDDEVLVEEKVDGSQFSMCRIDGQLLCRSKGKDLIVTAPEKMFERAVATADALDLHPGWVYRCEYLQSSHHNTLTYARVPAKHLIVFDICDGLESYLSPEAKAAEATRLGLECVPLLYRGKVTSLGQFTAFLDRESVLGGCKIEGVVIKNYQRFTKDKKAYVGKYVSEAFKEKHETEWKAANPAPADVVITLTEQLRTEARWNKAVQHLRETGALTDSPKDIGPLIKEVCADVEKEEADAVKDALYAHFWPKIRRGLTTGLPEFYKRQLAASAFPSPEP